MESIDYQNINWNDVWKKQMESHNNMPGGKSCSMYFNNDKIAKRYSDMLSEKNIYRFKNELLNKVSNINNIENFRILDVGSGPGTHTLPLSKIAKEVTAVEPAEAMASCLKNNLKVHEIDNVNCVNKSWEDIKLGQDIKDPYDVVIASFSLGMVDIEDALKKMNDASSGYVFLAWFTKVPTWDKIRTELWPVLYGVEYLPTPKVDCLINVLWQMDIYPNVSTYHKGKSIEFSNRDEFLDRYMMNFKLTTKTQEKALKDYIDKNMVDENGKILLQADENYSIVWWETK